MSTVTLFKPCGVGNFEWLRLAADTVDDNAEYAVGDAERLQEETGSESLVLIAPADKIGLRVFEFEASERKLLRQTVPYSLEDDLIDDVESLHFALGHINDARVDVAFVERDSVAEWRAQCAEQGLELQQVISELQLLPYQPDCWTLVVGDELWRIRYGVSQGFAMEADSAALALQLLLDNAAQPPAQLLVYANGADRDAIVNQLPELLRGLVSWQDDDYWTMVARAFRQGPEPINLLQGEFAVSLPWKKWWGFWKTTAILVAAAVVVNIVFKVVSIQVLEHRNLQLRADTEQAYRQAIPRGAVIRPEQQLRRQVEGLRGGSGERFMPLLDRIATVLASVPGLQLQTLNYSGNQGEVRVTLLANGFNDVEVARSSLEKAGLQAELGGSNSEGAKTRARLRIIR